MYEYYNKYMRKLYTILLTLIIFALAFIPIYAQDETLPDPGIVPDSPLYFLDTLGENFGLFFAFGNEAKAEKAVEIAGEKASEVKAMAQAGKSDEAEVAADRYGAMVSIAAENLATAAQSGEGVNEAVAEVVARATSIHLSVLADVYEQVPEEAKEAIQSAMQHSERGATEALKALGGENEPDVEQIRQEVQQRVQEAQLKIGMPEGVEQPQGDENIEENERGGPPANIPGGRPQ